MSRLGAFERNSIKRKIFLQYVVVHKENDINSDLIGTVLSLFSFRKMYEVKA